MELIVIIIKEARGSCLCAASNSLCSTQILPCLAFYHGRSKNGDLAEKRSGKLVFTKVINVLYDVDLYNGSIPTTIAAISDMLTVLFMACLVYCTGMSGLQ